MAKYHIVVVDDERPNLESLERILRSDGADVSCFTDPRDALAFLRQGQTDLLLTDLRMETWSGLELLEGVKLLDPSIEVVVMTAYGTVDVAVEAMKKGAYDFVTKPLQRVQVLKVIQRVLEKKRLVTENTSLKEELRSQISTQDIIGKSPLWSSVMSIARQAAKSRANVLIDGESGTGKGVLAEFLHKNSDYASQQGGLYVKINCTSIPENLLEAELFGYEPGAFTGAMKRKKGRIELANNGTLFLDEIGIAPPTFQAKLLRFLQDGEFERLGSNETIRIGTRVISATNTELKEAIRAGTFREDLFYRLNVIHVHLPPLRERSEDIPLLAKKFVEEAAKKNFREVPLLHGDTMEHLIGYRWPGNIRELQNLMERLVVLNRSGVIRPEELPGEIGGHQKGRSIVVPMGMPLREVERILMEETLKTTNGDKKLAAKFLGVHPRTIYRYLETQEQGNLPETPPPIEIENTVEKGSI